jgi:DNA polymerase I
MSTVYIIDTTNILFRMYHALPPLTTKAGVPTGAVRGVASWIIKFVRERRPTHVAAVTEGKGRNFRKNLYPKKPVLDTDGQQVLNKAGEPVFVGYKANRDGLSESILPQFDITRRLFEAHGMRVVQAPGYEADDAMASLCAQALREGHEAILCSADKDLMQLLAKGVKQIDPETNDYVSEERVMKKWGVRPGQIRDLLALAGDTSDGVPGVEGIGAGTAAKLLEKHETLAGVRAAAASVTGKRGEALRASIASKELDLWTTLVTLVDDLPLVDSTADLAWPGANEETLEAFYREFEFYKLMSTGMPAGGAPPVAPMYDAMGRMVTT